MEIIETKSRVYALLDEQGRVTRIEGEYSLPADLDGWTLIEEGAPCDRLNLAQSHYLSTPIRTRDGLYAWRYDEEEGLVLRTIEELEADRPKPSPSELREKAYETRKCITYGASTLTVDEANKLWLQYIAEGNSEKAETLTSLINEAKAAIREEYPDETLEETE